MVVEAPVRGLDQPRITWRSALRSGDGATVRTAGETGTLALDDVPLPARHHVAPWRDQYACLAHRPAWLVETARGCPFRCSFCSIWQLHARAELPQEPG